MLLAAVALPATAHAQETVTPPVTITPIPVPAPAPAPTTSAPIADSASRTTIAPGVIEQAEQEARERAAAQRAARPAPAQPRSAPVARAAPADATAEAPPPSATAAAPATPVSRPAQTQATSDAARPTAPAATVPTATAGATTQQADGASPMWLILAGLGAIAAVIAAIALLRRRRHDADYDTDEAPVAVTEYAAAPVAEYEPRPVAHPAAIAPVATAPAFAAPTPRHEPEVHASLENASLHRPDPADIDAVLGGAAPHGDRPQLELAMRPLRAGVTRNEGVVEFELTVANAGGVEAQDVRIGAYMLNGDARDSAMERMLIDPPADAVVEADAIAPGDGTRVDAAVTLPRGAVAHDHAGFTPLVLADARYRLPDGSEGRTAAAFAIGRVDGGEALVPIDVANGPAMYNDIEARLHSVAAKV